MDYRFNEALQLLEDGAFIAAANLFKAITQDEPENGMAHYYYAACCFNIIGEAEADYEPIDPVYETEMPLYIKKAIQLPLDSIEPYIFCGTLYQENKVHITTEELFFLADAIKKIEPQNSWVDYFLENGYANSGNWPNAIALLEDRIAKIHAEPVANSVKALPLAENYGYLGYYYDANLNKAAALLAYEKSYELAPDNHDLVYNAGLYAYENNEKEKAYMWWSKMYTWNTDSSLIEAVGDILKKEIETNENPSENLLFCGTEIIVESQYRENNKVQLYQFLIQIANKKLKADANSNMANCMLARAYSGLEDNKTALPYYEKYLAQVQNDPINLSRYISRYFEVHGKVLPLTYPQPYGEVGYDYYNAGCFLNSNIMDTDISLAVQMQVKELQQYFFSEGIQRFMNYFERQKGSAINNQSHIFAMCCHNAARAFRSSNPTTAIMYQELGLKYSQFDENINLLIKLYNETGQHEKALYWVNKNKEQKALYDFETVLETEGDYQNYFFNVVNTSETLIASEAIDEGILILTEALEKFNSLSVELQKQFEDNNRTFSNLIKKLAKAHDEKYGLDAMKQQFEKGIAQWPESVTLINDYGYLCFHAQKDYETAFTIYDNAINMYKNRELNDEEAYSCLLWNRGVVYENHYTDYTLAIVDYKAAYEILPNFTLSRNLMYCYFKLQQYAEATQYGIIAVEKYSNETNENDLSWTYGMLASSLQAHNKAKEALPYFEKCFEYNSVNKEDEYFNFQYTTCIEIANKKEGFLTKLFKK